MWLEISTHLLSDVRSYMSLRQANSFFRSVLPHVVFANGESVFQYELQVKSSDDFLSAQHVQIVCNGTTIANLFFACCRSWLYLHSASFECFQMHCHVNLQFSFLDSRQDLIFSQSGSLLAFLRKNYNCEKRIVITRLQSFLSIREE